MMDIGLGPSAFTTASHILLIVVLVLLFDAVQRILRSGNVLRGVIVFPSVRWSTSAVFASLIVERAYYVAARLLQPAGADLWGAHPAPELLSMGVALALFALAMSLYAALRNTWRGVILELLVKGSALAALFWSSVFLLY